MQNEELRRAKLELKEAHDRQVDLYDFAPVGYIVLDGHGRIISANQTAATLLGVERGSVLRRRFPEFVAGVDGDRWHRAFVALLQGDERAVHRLTLIRNDGATFDADVVCERRSGHDGNRVRIVLTDVTDRRREQEALRQTQEALRVERERLDVAAQAGGIGLWDLDLATNTAWRNIQHDRLFGYDELQATWGPEEAARHIVPEDRPLFNRAFEEALATGRFHYELRVNPAGKPMRWIEATGEILRDEVGKPVRMMGTVADVTDRRLAEEELRESERWLRLSQEMARLGHYVFDVQRDHWTSSATLDSIFGIDETYPRKGTDWLHVVHPDDRAMMGAYLADLLAHRARFDKEYRVVDQRSGDVVWVHGLGELQRAPGGEAVRLIGTIQDITLRKRVEIERNAMQSQLAVSSRLAAMGTLVSGVAHEINNPLAAEMADQGLALEVVREIREHLRGDSPLDRVADGHALEGVVEALEDAKESAERISRIVRDLSLFGNPDAKRQRTRIMDIVDGAMRWLPATVAGSASVNVENGGAPDVIASAGQIEQILVNLITNAAKAMPEGRRGTVIVRVGPGLPGMSRVEVIDHGTGIEPAIGDRIFDPFFTTRPTGPARGTGLGLAICQAIATAHNGTLTFESEVGKGSTFRLELPVAPAEA